MIAVLLVGFFSSPIAYAEDWSIQVRTLPPAINEHPNDIKSLNLTLQDFAVDSQTTNVTEIAYDETTFKFTVNVTVLEEYASIKIAIPTTVQNPAQNIGVYVDTIPNGYLLGSHWNRWIIAFEVPKGEHQVLLWLDSYQFPVAAPIPEFSMALPIVLLVMATMLLGVLVVRKQAKNKPSRNTRGEFFLKMKRGLNFLNQDFETVELSEVQKRLSQYSNIFEYLVELL